MTEYNINGDRKSLSRRDFTKKSFLALTTFGSTCLISFSTCDSKKLKTIDNVKRMGHCAPSVMQTLLDINNIRNDRLVLYSGAMAGGIAGSDTECGVLTAPLMFIGFRAGDLESIPEKLEILSKAQSYINEFTAINGTSFCRNIRMKGMKTCRKVMYNFYEHFSHAISNPVSFPDETKASYSMLLNAFDKNKFHCVNNVLKSLEGKITINQEMLDSAWLFNGGLAMLNRTCGALAAGVIALSSVTARREDSYKRVETMNRLLKEGNNRAMDEEINNFNRSINLSDELGAWFRNEFGTTSCYDIWKYNFEKFNDAENYISGQCMKQCRYISQKVADQVTLMFPG